MKTLNRLQAFWKKILYWVRKILNMSLQNYLCGIYIYWNEQKMLLPLVITAKSTKDLKDALLHIGISVQKNDGWMFDSFEPEVLIEERIPEDDKKVVEKMKEFMSKGYTARILVALGENPTNVNRWWFADSKNFEVPAIQKTHLESAKIKDAAYPINAIVIGGQKPKNLYPYPILDMVG